MGLSNEVILFIVGIAGFSIGCVITMIIAILINSSQQKKIQQSAQNRQAIVNSIGKLCASIENAYSAYRIGTMNYNTLRDTLVDKVEKINIILNGNIDILDSYYIKNIERFIVDQKCFLLHREDDKPVSATGQTVRGVSRVFIQDIDEISREEPLSTFESEPKAVIRKVPAKEVSEETDDVAVFEKKLEEEKAAKVEKPHKVDKKPEKITKKKEPKKDEAPVETEKVVKEEKTKKEGKAKKEEKPKSVEKPEEVEKPKIPGFKDKERKEDALSAFELGATASISKDTIKELIEKDKPLPDTAAPVQEGSRDEATLKESVDVEATQVFNVHDLMGKKQPLDTFPPVQEEEAVKPDEALATFDQKTKEVGGFFDLDIPGKPLAEKATEDEEDESLITGDDVMDHMDDFFGFRDGNK